MASKTATSSASKSSGVTSDAVVLKGHEGRVVGTLKAGVWCKKCEKSKHFLRTPPGIAVDADVYDRVKMTLRSLAVEDTETGDVYTLTREGFEAKKAFLDRGFGRQYWVALHLWNRQTRELRSQEALAL